LSEKRIINWGFVFTFTLAIAGYSTFLITIISRAIIYNGNIAEVFPLYIFSNDLAKLGFLAGGGIGFLASLHWLETYGPFMPFLLRQERVDE
jgi:hypothetical protein